LISALSKPADTLGGFLDQLSRASGVRWVFNAVQMITLQQTVATVVDKTGREAEVQMPAVPNPTKWMNAANGQFSPLGTTNGGTANSNQQASAPIQKLATDPPPSLWQQSMSYLSRALRICSTIFIVSLILGGIQEMIFFVRGVSGRATILLMPIAFTMFSAGVLATIGLGSAVLSSNLAAGIAGTILVGLGVLCYKAIIWLEPPSS
jgi:hypothetical protein